MSTKVLVVDDSPAVRQHISHTLAAAGFEVIEARDGFEALEQARGHQDLALIICDVSMPRMGGLELLATLRRDERFRTTPTVMLTTESQPELVERAKALAAKGWIIKPFKSSLLAAAAKRLARPPSLAETASAGAAEASRS